MAETKRTFEQDDLFNRKSYAEFLKRLILNSGSYHRDDDVQAYTIAIDSPWGTGKSVFLEKFENMLKADCPDRIRVVHYSAWKNDFWDNAFEPFADAIFTSEWFCSALEDNTNEQAMKNFFGAAKNVMLSFVKKQTEDHFDAELLEKAIEDFATGLKIASSKKVDFVSKSYLDYIASLKQMQKAMGEVLSKTLPGGKLVIVIDELDRCRPTFAIETLEIVKHIMDVKDVVYIFSLDVRQLGAAIKQVYGAETDATGYLMRFFSYYSRMPEADVEAMISHMNLANGVVPDAAATFSMIAKEFGLNARDIETVGKVFTLMKNELLKYYKCATAYKLYWLLLCFKYKRPIEFDKKMNGDWSSEEKNVGAFVGSKSLLYGLREPLKKIVDGSQMKDIKFAYMQNGESNGRSIGKIFRVDYGKERISLSADYTIDFFGESDSISGILFYPDMKRWGEIKYLTPAQFLLQQMEMFNFIPEIPSATE